VHNIVDRLSRAENFVAYLNEVWVSCPFRSQSFFNWDDISDSISKDIYRIKTKIL